MHFTLQINMDNAAFDYPEQELIRILQGVIHRLKQLDFEVDSPVHLYDSNGNRVGLAYVNPDE